GHAYDAMGRVTHEYSFQANGPTSLAEAQEAIGSPILPQKTVEYDMAGNVTRRVDEAGTQDVYTYDAFGRLATRMTATSDLGGTAALIRYDLFGRKMTEVYTNAAQEKTWEYDDAGRISKATDSAMQTVYTYYVNGRRATETLTETGKAAPSRQATYRYDAVERLLHWDDAATGRSVDYTYDSVGNVTSEKRDTVVPVTYTYDAANRPVHVDPGGGLATTIAYDDFGNRMSETSAVGT